MVGTDISEVMVTLAAARARSRGLKHVRFARMDAEDLSPLDDASFDAALCGLGLMYVPDPLKAVREMTRLVVPHRSRVRVHVCVVSFALLLLLDRPPTRVRARRTRRRRRLGTAQPLRLGRHLPDRRRAGEIGSVSDVLLARHRRSARDVFREAGLVDVVTERIETRLEWASDDEACGAAFVGGPVALAYSRFDARTRYRVRREYLDSIARWRIRQARDDDGRAASEQRRTGYSVPGEFVIVAGRRLA